MVNRKRNYTLHFYLMSVMVAIALGCVNYLGMEYRTRIDLTGDQRFTLSEGTESLFEKLTDPVTVTYYVDEEPPSKRINLERDVRDKLEELARSSNGKLEYRIKRIGNEEASTKASELEEIGVQQTVDIQKRGEDERAEMRGIQGYFSSIVIRYGTSEAQVINGVVNLVDRQDETREHRVDTLEFDIAFNILQMRNKPRRPPFDRLLKVIDQPVQIALYVTKDMPPPHKAFGDRVQKTLADLADKNPGEIEYRKTELDPDPQSLLRLGRSGIMLGVDDPFGSRGTLNIQSFAESSETQSVPLQGGQAIRIPAEMYFSFVYIRVNDGDSILQNAIADFTDSDSPSAVKVKIEDMVWEMFRPRTKVGFVLPPSDPRAGGQQRPGQPPVNGHTGIFQYIQSQLGYETEWVDIKGKKRIPNDLAVLVVMEPNLLSERELYEIDRYLSSGGNVTMLVQGWSADLALSDATLSSIPLTKLATEPHFEEWAKFYGLSFGEDILLRANGKLQPYVRSPRGLQRIPSQVRLAPVVEPQDLNGESVLARGLSSMPMPLVVEINVDEERVDELELSETDLIRFRGDVYRFFPANPMAPSIPTGLDLQSPIETEQNPKTEKGEDILAQRTDDEPLVATIFRGEFPGYWRARELKVPGWDGDPTDEDTPEVLNPRAGSLMVVSSAGMLNTDYLMGYQQHEVFTTNPGTGQQEFGPVLVHGINFYRNVAEANIYGDDLVNLRARSGVTPRVVGPVEDANKTFWFLMCIAGAPVVLLLFAGARSYIQIREREDYETALGLREDK